MYSVQVQMNLFKPAQKSSCIYPNKQNSYYLVQQKYFYAYPANIIIGQLYGKVCSDDVMAYHRLWILANFLKCRKIITLTPWQCKKLSEEIELAIFLPEPDKNGGNHQKPPTVTTIKILREELKVISITCYNAYKMNCLLELKFDFSFLHCD